MSDRAARSRPVISESDSKRALEPHLQDLIACIRHGFDEWNRLGELDRDLRAPLGPSPRAGFIYSHIVHEVRRRFHGRAGVTLATTRGLLVVHIGDSLVVRFKKLDGRGRSRNYPTRQQQLFQLQAELPGMGEGTRVTVGYQLDELAKAIKDILVVCPVGSRNEWSWSAPKHIEAASPITLTPEPAVLTLSVPETQIIINPQPAKRREDAAS